MGSNGRRGKGVREKASWGAMEEGGRELEWRGEERSKNKIVWRLNKENNNHLLKNEKGK